ncbi:MAG: glycosyltransferase [Spirochaetaceae bacterium]|nr:glycosyltransferase [Spirochaetaceae bacterium]
MVLKAILILYGITAVGLLVVEAVVLQRLEREAGHRRRKRERNRGHQKADLADLPLSRHSVSVIVCFRNEELLLGRLLDSLTRQSDQDFELVLVADRCSDRSPAIARRFASQASFPVQVLENRSEPSEGMNPKLPLLKKGINVTSGEILLFTDADCRVPRDWVAIYRDLFSDRRVGLAFGPVAVERPSSADSPGAGGTSLLSAYQHFDHMFRYLHAAATTAAGFPTGGYGNNMAVRAETYRKLGGFESLPASATEDAVLMGAVGAWKRWRVDAITDESLCIATTAKERLRDYFRQALRWAAGAFFSPHRLTRFSYRLLMLLLSMVFTAMSLSQAHFPLIFVPAAVLFYLTGASLLTSRFLPTGKSFLKCIPVTIPFFVLVYLSTTFILLFTRHVSWKGHEIELRPGSRSTLWKSSRKEECK